MNSYKEIIVDKDTVQFTQKAIKIPCLRSDGVYVNNISFPLSQLDIQEGYRYYTIKIPTWLYNKKVLTGFKLGF